jgi:hypothetical protein
LIGASLTLAMDKLFERAELVVGKCILRFILLALVASQSKGEIDVVEAGRTSGKY